MNEPLTPGEPLVVARAGDFRLLLPLRHLRKVHAAALPQAMPSADGEPLYCLKIEGELVPVVFARALLGAAEARLTVDDQVAMLEADGRHFALWVDAVEDVVPHTPFFGDVSMPAEAEGFMADVCDGDPALPVLDVARICERLHLTVPSRPGVAPGAPAP